MAYNGVQIENSPNIIVITDSDANQITVTQPITNVIEVSALGPQGITGPQGPTGSMAESNSGSFSITGSLTVSGSSTFTNIGPAIFSGSVSISGSALYNGKEILTTAISGGFVTTSSFNSFTSSINAFTASYNTGSFTGSFTGISNLSSLTASNALVTGNVTVLGTASINTLIVNQTQLSTGSNQLGDAVDDTQTLYGTVRIPTGSFTVTGSVVIKNTADISVRPLTINYSSSGYHEFFEDSNYIYLRSSGKPFAFGQAGASYSLVAVAANSFFPTAGTNQTDLGTSTAKWRNLYIGTNALIDGKTGIGTLTPSASLHISGSSGSVLLEIDSDSNQNILFVSGSGNVGIGTSTPTSRLYISTPNQNDIALSAGWANYPNLTVGTSTIYTTYQISNGNFDHIFSTRGTSGTTVERFRIKGGAAIADLQVTSSNFIVQTNVLYVSASGNIGIGTTSPTSSLHIVGPGTGSNVVTISPSGSPDIVFKADNVITDYSGLYIGNKHVLRTKNAATVFFNIQDGVNLVDNNSTRSTINSAGSFGLGIASVASIAARLHLRGTGTTSATTTLRVENANASASLVILDNGNVYSNGSGYALTNTAFGVNAFINNSTGTSNTAFGYQALYLTTGNSNTAIGSQALQANTTGTYNTAVGALALYGNTLGSTNTAIGYNSQPLTSTGGGNISLGHESLRLNTSGSNNNAIGVYALYSNTTGVYNVGVGNQTLFKSLGSFNTGLGGFALYNTTGSGNVAVGYGALTSYSGSNNTAVGYEAAYSNTTGSNITAIGYQALRANSGSDNTAVGYQSLASNTTGNYNTAVGVGSLQLNTSGGSNVAIGWTALQSNLTGGSNIAIGHAALYSNTAGGNIAIGMEAANSNTSSTGIVAIGYRALKTSTAANNVAIGYEAALTNTIGANIVAIGYRALYSNNASNNVAVGFGAASTNTGTGITAIGYQALNANNTGVGLTAVGYQALVNNTGTQNTAVGYQAAFANTSASGITAVGYQALAASTGNNNTAVGYQSLSTNTIGVNNVGFGPFALGLNSSGNNNIAVGYRALYNNTTNSNIAIGHDAAFVNTSGTGIVAIGYQALSANTTGSSNTAIGYQALLSNSGSSNTALGYQAGLSITTGNNNTLLGNQAASGLTTTNNNVVVGHQASVGSTGDRNTVVGTVANSAGYSNVVIVGMGALATAASQIVIGSGSIGINGVTNSTVLGTPATTLTSIPAGALIINTTSSLSATLGVKSQGSTSATNAFTLQNASSTTLLTVRDDGNTSITGNTQITGSLAISASAGTGSAFSVYKSGSTVMSIQGSQGELFSITDSLSGSLFSVSNISGLPILEVFSDNTVLLGSYLDPMLMTTQRVTANSGSTVIYSLPTSSYDGVFVDYVIRSGSNARAGQFMGMWSGSTTTYTDNSTTDFGSTTGFIFGLIISGSNMVLTGSASTSGWTVRAGIRSI